MHVKDRPVSLCEPTLIKVESEVQRSYCKNKTVQFVPYMPTSN